MSIKEMVGQGKKVFFVRYQNNELWYVTETGFEFPIPQLDMHGAIFLNEDKAILFMRWIIAHLKAIEIAKNEHDVVVNSILVVQDKDEDLVS